MRYKNTKVIVRFADGLEVSKEWLYSDNARQARVLGPRYGGTVTCTCVPDGIAMHIVRRQGTYYLASMPGLSSHHALSCPSYIDDPDTNGLRFYTPKAISRANGIHRLSVSDGSSVGSPSQMSPSAVIQFLWYQAGLHICTPKTVHSRTAYLASLSLFEASQSIRINRLRTTIHIPMMTDASNATHVCGQLRNVSSGPYSNRITLAGEKNVAYWVRENDWNDVCVHYFGRYESPQVPECTTWIFGAVSKTSKGNLVLSSIGAVPVTKELLICSRATAADIDSLIDDERRFFVGLDYDAPPTLRVPKAVIIDEKPPKPIYRLG